jgi:GNAT superfamily N-acetyltransferase
MTAAARSIIRVPVPDDRAGWDPLWQGYLRFYRARLDPEITEATWARLIAPDSQPQGLVAQLDGRLVGLAHYLFHPSTWSATAYCYLEDLFVLPETRGRGVARALIEAVYAAADAAGATSVYWHTQEFNADGRALYDTLAHRTSFIVYQR